MNKKNKIVLSTIVAPIMTLIIYGVISLVIPNIFSKNKMCVQTITRACFLKLPFVCIDFSDPCQVPPLWFVNKPFSKPNQQSIFQSEYKRVIVEVKIDPPLQFIGDLSEAEQKRQEENISKTVDKVLSGLKPNPAHGVTKFKFTPSFAISADKETLEYLSNHPLVTSVEEESFYSL